MVCAMKENQKMTKAAAGRIGGLAKVAKGFAVNAKAHAEAIRASAKVRKAAKAKRRALIAALVKSGVVS